MSFLINPCKKKKSSPYVQLLVGDLEKMLTDEYEWEELLLSRLKSSHMLPRPAASVEQSSWRRAPGPKMLQIHICLKNDMLCWFTPSETVF